MAGPGPIAISEVFAYCQMFGVRGQQERLRLLDVVQKMDQVFLDFLRETAPKAPAK